MYLCINCITLRTLVHSSTCIYNLVRLGGWIRVDCVPTRTRVLGRETENTHRFIV